MIIELNIIWSLFTNDTDVKSDKYPNNSSDGNILILTIE